MTEPSARPCAVPGCAGTCTDSAHAVNAAPAATLPHFLPLCEAHWREIEADAEWFAEERLGERGRRGIDVVMGEDLTARRIVVAADEDGVAWRRGGFSARLDRERNFGVLAIEGRVYGSDEHAHLDLALTPDVVRTLRSIVRLYDAQGSP